MQVGATHGVHVPVNARITGAAYKTALTITVALVVFAFTLSFQALRELAVVYAGMNTLIACLVPLVIDLSITGSTVSILALTRAHREATVDAEAETHSHSQHIETPMAEAVAPAVAPVAAGPKPDLPNESERDAEPDQVVTVEPDEEARPAEASDWGTKAPQAETIPVAAFAAAPSSESAKGPSERPQVPWVGELSLAEQIVHEGGIQIGLTKVAQILHAHRQSTPPGTIARNVGCGFRTVKKIIDKVEDGQLVPA